MARNEEITGVSRFLKKGRRGRVFPYWQATIKDENGRWRNRQFFIKGRGEDEARRLAVDCRKEWEKAANQGNHP